MLEGKKILVTGGTGSFGRFIVSRLSKIALDEIRIFSRDEKKQFDMKQKFAGVPNLRFIVGDLRDQHAVREVVHGVDIVFQAAALKQVPNCELYPMEAIKTNILGVEYLIKAAMEEGVEKVIAISTDKAVKPVNVMGMTKAIQEKLIINANSSSLNRRTAFTCVRYGNVMNSRGSVIPFFKRLIKQGKTIPITHPQMTRFILTLGDAIDLVMYATENCSGGEIYVKKAPSARIIDIARILTRQMGVEKFDHEIVGIFPGEKVHEILVSEEEMTRCHDYGQYYVISPWVQRPTHKTELKEYSSADNLAPDELVDKLIRKSEEEASLLEFEEGYFTL